MKTHRKRRPALTLRHMAAKKLKPQPSTVLSFQSRDCTCLYLDTHAPPYPVLLGSAAVLAANDTSIIPCIGIPVDTDDTILEAIRQIDTNANLPLDVQCTTLRAAGLPDSQIAQCLATDRATVTRYAKLHEANDVLRDLVRSGELTLGHARILMRLDLESQGQWAQHAVAAKLTIPELASVLCGNTTEEPPPSETATHEDGDAAHVERTLSERLAAPVHLAWPAAIENRTLTIEAWGIEALCGILEAITRQTPDQQDATHYKVTFSGLTADALDHLAGHLLGE